MQFTNSKIMRFCRGFSKINKLSPDFDFELPRTDLLPTIEHVGRLKPRFSLRTCLNMLCRYSPALALRSWFVSLYLHSGCCSHRIASLPASTSTSPLNFLARKFLFVLRLRTVGFLPLTSADLCAPSVCVSAFFRGSVRFDCGRGRGLLPPHRLHPQRYRDTDTVWRTCEVAIIERASNRN